MKWLVAVLVSVAFVGGTVYTQPAPSRNLSAAEQDGQRLFQTRCAMCHVGVTVGTELRQEAATGPFGPPLSKRNITSEDGARQKIAGGGSRMPGYQLSLRTDQIDHVIAYLKTLDAPETRIFSSRPGE